MPATTLKLPQDLKERIASLARDAGKSPHAYMVDALEQQALRAGQRRTFVADAATAENDALRTGKAYPAGEVHRYFAARSAGKTAARPRLKRWRK